MILSGLIFSLGSSASCFAASSIGAGEMWSGDNEPFAVTIINNRDSEIEQHCYFRNIVKYDPVLQAPKPVHTCITPTSYGAITHDGYVRVGSESEPYRKIILEDRLQPIPVANSSGLLVLRDMRDGQWGKQMGKYDNFVSDFQIQLMPMGGYIATKEPKTITEAPHWSGDTDIRPFRTKQIAHSWNGQHIVFDSPGGIFYLSATTSDYPTYITHNTYYDEAVDTYKIYDNNLSLNDDGTLLAISHIGSSEVKVHTISACIEDGYRCDIGLGLKDIIIANDGRVNAIDKPFINSIAGSRQIVVNGRRVDGSVHSYAINSGFAGSMADYIALGDSFSSGEGDMEMGITSHYFAGTDGTAEYPQERCHSSDRAYPWRLQANTTQNLSLTYSLACSGATTDDIVARIPVDYRNYPGQYRQIKKNNDDLIPSFKSDASLNITPGRIAQHEFVKKFKPKSVTITIGGNDVRYASIITTCIALMSECGKVGNDRYAVGQDIFNSFTLIKEAIASIHNASPSTKIYVISYPQFVSIIGLPCPVNAQGLSLAERIFIRESISYMNEVLKRAAHAEGAAYVDISNSLSGSELCSGSSRTSVNGLVVGGDVHGFGFESFHPNAIGHEYIANYITAHYGSLPDLQASTCSTQECMMQTPPPIPSYFGINESTPQSERRNLLQIIVDLLMSAPIIQQGSKIPVVDKGLRPNQSVRLEIHSDALIIGEGMTDNNGEFKTEVSIPTGIDPGLHTLHIYSKDKEGNSIDHYQDIFIIGPTNDIDDDGIDDSQDTCLFVASSGTDINNDLVDDACPWRSSIAPVSSNAPSQQVQEQQITSIEPDNSDTFKNEPNPPKKTDVVQKIDVSEVSKNSLDYILLLAVGMAGVCLGVLWWYVRPYKSRS